MLRDLKYPTVVAVTESLRTIAQEVAAVLPDALLLIATHPGEGIPPEGDAAAWAEKAREVADYFSMNLLGEPGSGLETRASGRVEWRKPRYGMAQEAMGHFKVGFQRTVYIGDMDSDRQFAAYAGIEFLSAAEWRAGALTWQTGRIVPFPAKRVSE